MLTTYLFFGFDRIYNFFLIFPFFVYFVLLQLSILVPRLPSTILVVLMPDQLCAAGGYRGGPRHHQGEPHQELRQL